MGCFCITLQLRTYSCRHQELPSESEVTPSGKAKNPSGSNNSGSNSEPAVMFNFILDVGFLDMLASQLVRLPKYKYKDRR